MPASSLRSTVVCFLALRLLAPQIVLVAAQAQSNYSFTEPPYSEPDFYRNYILGETVDLAWTVPWVRVTLRLSPSFDWGTVYGYLLNDSANYYGVPWTVGVNDGLNCSVAQTYPAMVFQLTDATGQDNFTLDSRSFLVHPNTSSCPTFPQTPNRNNGGLTTAAKVGLGVGIPLACLLVLSWLFFYLRTRSRKETKAAENRSQPRHNYSSPTTPLYAPPAELYVQPSELHTQPPELYSGIDGRLDRRAVES